MKHRRLHHARPGSRAAACEARAGFTLVEMAATMVIIGVLMTIASTVVWSATKGLGSGSISAQLNIDASVALQRLVREFRDIPKKSGLLAPDITSVTPTTIAWGTNGTLALSGTNLILSDAGGTSRILLGDVSGFVLQCYDESNAALASSLSGSSCDAVRRISVTITLLRGGVSEPARTKVFIRSLISGA